MARKTVAGRGGMFAWGRPWPVGLGLLLVVPAAAEAPPIGWQEAVARLAGERTRAEACAGLLRRYGDEAAKAQGQVAYGEAKAEVDGVVAGLTVALARHAAPASLPDLDQRLGREVTRLDAVCARAKAAAPQEAGTKGGVL